MQKIEWSKNWLDSLSHKKKIENGANNSEDHCSLREKTRAGEKSENPRGEGASSNVVGKIFPPVSTGLTDLPKSGGANTSLAPQFRRPWRYIHFGNKETQPCAI